MSVSKLQQPQAIKLQDILLHSLLCLDRKIKLPYQQRLPSNQLCATVKPRPTSLSLHTSTVIVKQIKNKCKYIIKKYSIIQLKSQYSNNRVFLNAHHHTHMFSQGIISMSMNSSLVWFCFGFYCFSQVLAVVKKIYFLIPASCV